MRQTNHFILNRRSFFIGFHFIAFVLCYAPGFNQPINRQALVERHTVINTAFDSLSSLSVGNGRFAFTTDVTGLQSFPDAYAKGVALGTQSEWGWHSFPNTAHYKLRDAFRTYHLNGRDVQYAVQVNKPELNKKTSDYFRQNLHRLQLGNIGLEIYKKDGLLYDLADVKNIHQTLNMWNGDITSRFTVENLPVEVITYCHQQQDLIAVKITSPLIQLKRIKVRLRLPYPTGGWSDVGNNWNDDEKHTTTIIQQKTNRVVFKHQLDTNKYYITTQWNGIAALHKKSAHYYTVDPSVANSFEISFRFSEAPVKVMLPSFATTASNNKTQWPAFWKTGAAVDFSGSSDRRAIELERRVVLSQYLTRIQSAGNNPPQETGLTYNSWYGKPHMEMHWWHTLHFGLWGRMSLMEKSLDWYKRAAAGGREIARRQGYAGIRWQKMTDNDGREVPSSIGAFLIWQQPHFIYFTELAYRDHKDLATLNKYKDLVFATADFMASFPYYDSAKGRYILGKGVIAAQERFKAEETFNPTYELAYWNWALTTAQKWRERLHLLRNKKWDEVIAKLSPLPVQGDKYLFTESATDSYTNPEFRTDHPSVFGAFGMLPQTGMVDTTIMHNTFNWIWNNWTWDKTWGWDFPMTAMTATRLGLPEKAIEALLMPIHTNTYLVNGHNYQDDRLTIYLPGNGGLLTAVALMCAGYDGCTTENPGIPKDGKWKVKWEGLMRSF
ncbi:MAG: hypothetical protein ABJB11_03650 [Ferruginibacter sp.]